MPALVLLSVLSALTALGDTGQSPVRAVPAVDLARYAGRWYEIARLPNSFQAKCTGETTADYELLANGQMRVVNQCRQADGTMKRAEGRARLADRKGPTSKLKVRFAPAFLSFLSAVWGDYWVLDLTEDYSAALVGEPGRRYLWVLSRTPVLTDSICRRMLDTAVRQGFDVTRLVRSPTGSGGTCGG
jgi:apolipoprotein D and lipocalin family protein